MISLQVELVWATYFTMMQWNKDLIRMSKWNKTNDLKNLKIKLVNLFQGNKNIL